MKKLLIIDDDKDIIQLLFLIFQNDFEVYKVFNYKSAIESVKQNKPNITIIDYNIDNEKNGLDLAREIKLINSFIKIYILTGMDEREEILNYKGKIIEDCFSKSISPYEILEKIKTI